MADWLVLYIFSEPLLPSDEMGYRNVVIEEDDTLASDNIPSTTVGPRWEPSFSSYTKRLYLYSIDICSDHAGVTYEEDYIRYDILS